MTFVGIILIGTLIIVYETPPLYRQKRYKDLLVFLILTLLGLTLGILILMDIPVGSPTAFIENASTLLFKTFKKIARLFAR